MILIIVYVIQYIIYEVVILETIDELINSLSIELKRGTIVLLVLSQLHKQEYGYSLVQKLEDKKMPVEASTLYPLLRRLEKQELLNSEWDTSENRPRKFYVISERGKEVYKLLKNEWRTISSQIENLLKEEEENGSN